MAMISTCIAPMIVVSTSCLPVSGTCCLSSRPLLARVSLMVKDGIRDAMAPRHDDCAPDDCAAIRQLVDDWALLRDAGRWDEFAEVWHDDGWMTATWFQGPYEEFVEVSREGFERGVQISHFLGGHTCVVEGDRAIAQTKMKIEQRATVHGVDVDVTCSGRFYDFLERRHGRWGLVRRQPVYERDRLDLVDPAASLQLESGLLAAFPPGYRHLAYVQESVGYRVMTGLPGLTGPEVELLCAEGRQWLAGSAAPGAPLHDPRGAEKSGGV